MRNILEKVTIKLKVVILSATGILAALIIAGDAIYALNSIGKDINVIIYLLRIKLLKFPAINCNKLSTWNAQFVML
ncbi:MAG: hypothetical protein GC137_07360 [Alphaproteobacteria bacterium]|nr:hypothetical protein [Alphaproteobacteria bacterium]